jgi:hypothetical protein
MKAPKFVALDTSTLGNLARDCESSLDAREVVAVLNSGECVPYLTWHHIQELIQHADLSVYKQRLTFLRSLQFIAFAKGHYDPNSAGTIIDLRDFEIGAALEGCPASDAVENVRRSAISGFTSGREFCRNNLQAWEDYRTLLSEDLLRRQGEIASLTRFPPKDPKMRIPKPNEGYSLMTFEEAQSYFEKATQELEAALSHRGDKRLRDPAKIAKDMMAETFRDSMPLFEGGGDPTDKILRMFDVDPARLPKNARVEDAGYEAVFVKSLTIHAARLKVDYRVLRERLRQEQLPSWIVWRELDRRLGQLPKASASDMNDVTIAAFGLYVDHIEVDKRVAELVRQASGQKLLDLLNSRLLHYRGYKELAKLLAKGKDH